MENNHQENPQDPEEGSGKHSYEDDMFFDYLSERSIAAKGIITCTIAPCQSLLARLDVVCCFRSS
jgi:hypothetical protein